MAKLPLAKILDTWGRPQGITLMVVIWTVGLVMMAATNSITLWAAAQVFCTVGYAVFFPFFPFLQLAVDPSISSMVPIRA